MVRPAIPKSWIPDRPKEAEGLTVVVPDPDAPPPPPPNPKVVSIIKGGPGCAPKGAEQSAEHEVAFERAVRLLFDGDVPAAITALRASLGVAANKTEESLSWQVLGDLYQDEGMTAEEAEARQIVADLGCISSG